MYVHTEKVSIITNKSTFNFVYFLIFFTTKDYTKILNELDSYKTREQIKKIINKNVSDLCRFFLHLRFDWQKKTLLEVGYKGYEIKVNAKFTDCTYDLFWQTTYNFRVIYWGTDQNGMWQRPHKHWPALPYCFSCFSLRLRVWKYSETCR